MFPWHKNKDFSAKTDALLGCQMDASRRRGRFLYAKIPTSILLFIKNLSPLSPNVLAMFM